MDSKVVDTAQALYRLRQQNPAWVFLASRRAPLIASILNGLFAETNQEVTMIDAEAALAAAFETFANEEGFERSDDFDILARRELRDWIKKKLIVERGGRVSPTAALAQAQDFIDSIQETYMTSTASRLGTVQSEIEKLSSELNADPQERLLRLKSKLKSVQEEIGRVKQGEVSVLPDAQATERIREIYQLAVSLKSDFRRVEDSYRSADIELRRSFIAEDHNRGEVVEQLLQTQETLLATAEGQVFDAFYEQLSYTGELELMKAQLRQILAHEQASKALRRDQHLELRFLSNNLVQESRQVIEARARSENDVKSFIKAGVAIEHHRITQVTRELFEIAGKIDWASLKNRRLGVSLPPVGLAVGSSVPLVERLRFSTRSLDQSSPLNLVENQPDLADLDDELWQDFNAFDDVEHVEKTRSFVETLSEAVTIAQLFTAIQPEHPTEAIVAWLEIANQASLAFEARFETIEANISDAEKMIYKVPVVYYQPGCLKQIDLEI